MAVINCLHVAIVSRKSSCHEEYVKGCLLASSNEIGEDESAAKEM